MMLVPGLVSATFKGRPVDNVLKIAEKAGLSAIEWSENHHIPKGDLAFARDVAARTKDCGLELAGYGSYYRLGQGMDVRESLDTAAAMGACQMRIWAGSKASSEVDVEERSALVEDLSKAAETAESYNIVLNLEWHKNTLTDTNESGLATLEAVGSPYLRTLWQPTQALSLEERAEGLSMIAPYLSYLHVYYWDEGGRRPLEEGIEHWRRYFSLLENRKHYALLEFVLGDSEQQFLSDAKVLKGLIKEIER